MGVLTKNILGKRKPPLTRPWSVQIGMVEGCNRLCTFCGLNAIRTKVGENIKYMEIKEKKINLIRSRKIY